MSRWRQVPIVDPEGIEGVVLTTSRFLDDDPRKLVRLAGGEELLVANSLLQTQADGTYVLQVPFRQLLQPASTPTEITAARVIPAIEERLRVERQQVETGRILIHKRVESTESRVDEPTVHDDYVIERVPVNRIVDGPIEPSYEGDTLVLPVLEEVLVVEKRLVLREEMRITKRRQEVRDPQTYTVRREYLEVERVGEAQS